MRRAPAPLALLRTSTRQPFDMGSKVTDSLGSGGAITKETGTEASSGNPRKRH